jgi:general secretion pathway protein G
MWAKQKQQSGFTIVELLIVIVVIGILAAITIVAYNGVQNRAKTAALTSDLRGAAMQIKAD